MRKKTNILIVVKELFDFIEMMADAKSRLYFYTYTSGFKGKISEHSYYYKVGRFLDYGLIKKTIKNNRVVYEITDKAKHIRTKPSVKKERTDGLSTIIMFDIPESKHKSRDAFRRYLLKNGYTQIQKSVFISPFEVFKEISEMIHELQIIHNVTVLSGKIDHRLE